jgi:hypothetical protein
MILLHIFLPANGGSSHGPYSTNIENPFPD